MTGRLLLVAALIAGGCSRPQPPVILISIDTLRADHVGFYGGPAATPNIDALARRSIVCRNAWSHCPLTLPSHLSILTGLLPQEHGVRDNAGYRFDAAAHPTVSSILQQNGYRTGAAVSSYVLRKAAGASAGFEDYDDAIGIVDGAPTGMLQRSGAITEKIAEEWITRHGKEPFFYFLHIYEPHTPRQPTYDADIAAADAIIGKFIAFLKRSGIDDRALIILLSDHGEGLMQHGEDEHGVFLYGEALRVPLLIKPPGMKQGRTIGAPVQLIDVMPTILDATGVKKTMRGVSLLGDVPKRRTIVAESLYPRIHFGWSDLRSIVDDRFHLIDAPRDELYDLRNDGAEQRNIAAGERRVAGELRGDLDLLSAGFKAPAALDREEARKLASLGYVSGGATESGALPDSKDRIHDVSRLQAIAQLNARGETRQAIALAEALLADNPRWSDLRDQLGSAYDRLGDHARAARVFLDGMPLSPALAPSFALEAATSLLDAGEPAEAERHARLASTAGAPGSALLLGEIALARGNLEDAAREQQRAASNSGDRAHALFLAARIAAARREYPRALELIVACDRERLRTGASLPAHFHYVAADALAHVGRVDDAIREFRAEIASDPGDVQAYADQALLHYMRGDRDTATALLAEMAEKNARPEVAMFAASSLERWGDRAGAAKCRRKAASMH